MIRPLRYLVLPFVACAIGVKLIAFALKTARRDRELARQSEEAKRHRISVPPHQDWGIN